jgi:hypothetical protein
VRDVTRNAALSIGDPSLQIDGNTLRDGRQGLV